MGSATPRIFPTVAAAVFETGAASVEERRRTAGKRR